ncbi:hypothetical protein ACCS60_27635 [Rhizobium acaciae]|uniref:hypothetical protein n=1 Tax=Rhizobium acaciae TaxID=2989736 RepID=UPI003F9E6C18
MTKTQVNAVEANEITPVEKPYRRNSVREDFDAEVHLPAKISKEFLSAALLWAVKNEVEFGIFHEPNKIVISFLGGDEHFMPSRWSDKRWHIGEEDIEPAFFPDDYA